MSRQIGKSMITIYNVLEIKIDMYEINIKDLEV